MGDGLIVGWTCCRSFENTAYLEFNSRGCKRSEKHEEDHFFTDTMKLFPFDPNANRDEQLKKVLFEESARAETTQTPHVLPALEKLLNHPSYIAHRVTKVDTLAGLALKYKTNTATIKRVNRLPNDMVFQREIIFIPKSVGVTAPIPSVDDMGNGNKISYFVAKTGCVAEESSFYLEEANWDVDQALKNWREDLSWSKSKN